jgi:hypothetical protein
MSPFDSTPTLKAKLLNLIARRKTRDTQDMLTGMKAAIEKAGAEHKIESER